MTIKERANNLGKKYARQYHHNNCYLTDNQSFVFSDEEIKFACIEMANEQKNIDKELFIEIIYNLIEIGDIDVHNIYKVIDVINKKMEE